MMTLNDIRGLDKPFLTPKEVAGVLGSDPQTIRVTARTAPERVGFPFTLTRNRMKIPRIPFLNFMEGRESE